MNALVDDTRGLSRRRFIVQGAAAGGLLIGFSLPLVSRLAKASASASASGAGSAVAASTVNAWIRIGTDESITIYVGSSEMGQACFRRCRRSSPKT
jgi:isoquinoline 1-oxidoreductase beta subunit